MIHLKVWLTMPNGITLPAGEIATADPDENGAISGQFRYNPDYLAHQEAFALDPLHIPLSSNLYDACRPYAGVHGVFEDSLPDDWGRRILTRRYKLGRSEQRVPNLLQLLGAESLGALSFSDLHNPVRSDGVGGHELVKLMRLAEEFEKNSSMVDDDLALLFEAGSSPGGARPKVVVEHNGKSWLAKFPSIRDKFDVVALEAASMHLAGMAGVAVAHSEMIHCGSKRVLLVERFDVTSSGGRNHLVSMQTLTGADGYYHLGYCDLADIMRRISANPAGDLNTLFRQMVFNVMLGNTDDHLKNFCMVHDDDGWRLSPAYDLLPNIGMNREHQLHIGSEFRPAGIDVLLREASHFGMKRQQKVREIIREIYDVVSSWRELFNQYKVPEDDIEIIGKDISRNLAAMEQ